MKNKVLAIALALVLVVATVQPVLAAKEYVLLIHNNTESNVKINLEGPSNYSFTVPKGWTEKLVEEGDYEYTYAGCSGKTSGDITVDKNDVVLVIEKCGPPDQYAKFVVDSHLPGTITVTMSGADDIALEISLGKNKFPQMLVGYYQYSYDACGQTLGGEIHVTKNGQARLILKSCEALTYNSYGVNKPSNLRIGSHYAFPVNITMINQENSNLQYFKAIVPGLNLLNVVAGTYNYFYTAYGVTKSGTITVPDYGTGFVISPLH